MSAQLQINIEEESSFPLTVPFGGKEVGAVWGTFSHPFGDLPRFTARGGPEHKPVAPLIDVMPSPIVVIPELRAKPQQAGLIKRYMRLLHRSDQPSVLAIWGDFWTPAIMEKAALYSYGNSVFRVEEATWQFGRVYETSRVVYCYNGLEDPHRTRRLSNGVSFRVSHL